MDTSAIIQYATPIVTPLIIAGVKKVQSFLPRWTLPLLAAILGGGIDAANAYFTGHQMNLFSGALLGLAGVGVREAVDQVKKGQ